ncbi:MAG: hypothetical protein JWP03_1627 [Phycisphaerales bacterium]|jgi:predicted nucleic acid-binding protein|nr:hypothetical protein [Phycisphaerales bacterium]
MTPEPIRVVYDCVVFLQGAGRRNNAARKCLELVDAGAVTLCLSRDVLVEIEDVLSRPIILNNTDSESNTRFARRATHCASMVAN